jgi:hypothetical protein
MCITCTVTNFSTGENAQSQMMDDDDDVELVLEPKATTETRVIDDNCYLVYHCPTLHSREGECESVVRVSESVKEREYESVVRACE